MALGGVCLETAECIQIIGVMCGDNGFVSDGPLNCCTDGLQCQSDADCCGDMRCGPQHVTTMCMMPPFPTRGLGMPCTSHGDCLTRQTGVDPPPCVNGICINFGNPNPTPQPISDEEAALITVEELSALEAAGQFDALYDRMHPDAQAVVSRAAVVGWYTEAFAPRGPRVAEAIKVHSVPWTWPVTGKAYPVTAVVAYRQPFSDGMLIRGDVQLVKDHEGNWGWFFGRDRTFVEEQIARFAGGQEEVPLNPTPGGAAPPSAQDPGIPAFSIVDLGTGDGNWSSASHINERGDVLWGWATNQDPMSNRYNDFHPMLWRAGVNTDLSATGFGYTIALNDAGAVLGGGMGRNLLYQADTDTVLPVPGFDQDAYPADINNGGTLTGQLGASAVLVNEAGIVTIPPPMGYGFVGPSAINEQGHVAGTARPSRTDESVQRAVVFADGVVTVLGPAPGTESSRAADLNDVGQLVGGPAVRGMHSVRQTGRGFLYDHGTETTTDVGTLPGYQNSVAIAVNNQSQVVGFAWLPTIEADRMRRAFLYDHRTGVITDLNQLISQISGWYLVDAIDINDAGQIVGRGLIGDEMHAFLLTPQA